MGKERKSRAYTAVAAYVRALRWCRFIVIGFWLAVLGTGVKYAFNLLDKVYTNGIPSDLPGFFTDAIALPSPSAALCTVAVHCTVFIPAQESARPFGKASSTHRQLLIYI